MDYNQIPNKHYSLYALHESWKDLHNHLIVLGVQVDNELKEYLVKYAKAYSDYLQHKDNY